MVFNLNASTIFASLFWSAIGSGYWIYGKKQRTMPPMVGGIAIIAVSCLIESAVIMSLVSIAIMVGTYFWLRNE
jgi:hypothetical protein